MALEVDDFASRGAERTVLARIPPLPYLHSVTPGFKWYFDGLMECKRTNSVAVNRNLEPTTAKFDAKPDLAAYSERC
jgi:hypothetical protein